MRTAGCLASHAGEVLHLVPARRARGGEHGVRSPIRARGRQELPLPDGLRHVVVIGGVAERSRHAAAAGVEVGDRRARNAPEQRRRRGAQTHRALVAVHVEEDLARARPAGAATRGRRRAPTRGTPRTAPRGSATTRALSRSEPLSRSGASSRTADRQLGSTKTIGAPCDGAGVERAHVPGGAVPRLAQQPLRNQRAAAADVRSERRAQAGRPASTSKAATPISGSTCDVKVSAKSTGVPSDPA